MKDLFAIFTQGRECGGCQFLQISLAVYLNGRQAFVGSGVGVAQILEGKSGRLIVLKRPGVCESINPRTIGYPICQFIFRDSQFCGIVDRPGCGDRFCFNFLPGIRDVLPRVIEISRTIQHQFSSFCYIFLEELHGSCL